MNARDQIRIRVAQTAARILAEEGIQDYFLAKQKAAARLGIPTLRNLPRNEEIDAALEEYHRLYRAQKQPRHIHRLRRLALEAMQFLQAFSPRLVGGVLEGYAGEFSPITLHLFPDSPEDVIKRLMEGQIPFSEKLLSVTTESGHATNCSTLCFLVDSVEVQLVLPPTGTSQQRWWHMERNIPTGDAKCVAALLECVELHFSSSG